ncbi:MAG: hypothetical protein KAI40_05045 [Desulfobacterales bacterium]|nr:hypothetical protein [Desulfobacterales bacterium]
MTNIIYQDLCIANIFNGLVEGLSKFSNQSKLALIYSPNPDSDVFVYDPQAILKEHESILKEKHLDTKLSTDYPSSRNFVGSSGYILKNYSLQAIADYIVDERNSFFDYDSRLLIPPILNTVLNISKTREEGLSPRGQIFFTDPDKVSTIEFMTKIQRHQRPFLSNIKHIRKLLTAVENSNRKLVSDGNTIIGITDSPVPDYAIAADYFDDHGFLKLGKEKISSFFGENFH